MTTLEKLLEFEENYDVLKFRFQYKKLLLWPFIRSHLFSYIINYEDGIVVNRSQVKKTSVFKKYIKYNTFNLKQSDVLFLTESMTLVKEDGKWSDRIVQAYIDVTENISSNIIRVGTDFDYSQINRPYVTLDYIQNLIEYDEKCSKMPEKERDIIREFIEFLKLNLPFKLESGAYGFVYDCLEGVIKRLPCYYKYYGRLIKKAKPKVVFWNCASYSEPAIKVLNDLGVITAEFQHGYIGSNHQAYNFSKKIKECSEYALYLPKFFLSYGPFWTQGMRMVPEVIPIGNPIISEKVEMFKHVTDENDNKNILLIESNYTQKYIECLKEILSETSNDYKIYIKLHPSTLSNRRYYSELAENDRVTIVETGTVYEWFEKCKYIIGDTSTALYEAAAVGKTVYVIDSEASRKYIKEGCGIRIKNGYEVCHNIKNAKKEDLKQSTDFFVTDWEVNFQHFLENNCNIKL